MGGLIDEARRNGASSGGGAGAPAAGPLVYWGSGSRTTYPPTYSAPDGLRMGVTGTGTKAYDITDDGARGGAMLVDLQGRKRVYDALIAAGVITKQTGFGSSNVNAAWAQAMQFSASEYAKGNKLTPWDILKMFKSGGYGGSGGRGGGAAGPFSGTRTTTQSDVSLTDKRTARQMAEAILEEELGRAPDEAEFKQFVKELWDEEKASPTKVTTSTTYKAGIATSSTSKRSGGLDAPGKQDVMEEVIDDDPELAAERDAQLEANYVNVIQRLVGGGE